MIRINLTNTAVIKAYMEALGSVSSTVKIDRTISPEEQINILSVALNAMTAVNKYIPVNYNKINTLEFLNDMGPDDAGKYQGDYSRIRIANTTDQQNKDAKLAIHLAHEYGHHIYTNILTSEDPNLIKKMDALVEKMGDVFISQKHSKLNYLAKKPNMYKSTIDYLSEPTEMFARAFSGLVLKDMESTFKKGSCYTYNYSSKEIEIFEKELKEICSLYSRKVISNSKESVIDRNLFKNLSFNNKTIICKNENLLYHKNVYKKRAEALKNNTIESTNIDAEDILRKKTYTSIFTSTTKEYQNHLKFDSKSDIYIGETYSDIVDRFKAMLPNEVYFKEQALLSQKEDIEKILLLSDNTEKIKQLNIKLESIDINLKAIESSGVKERDDFKDYAALRSKKKSIEDFINRLNVASEGKIASKIESIKLVQFIKQGIVKKFGCKVLDVEDKIKKIETQFNNEQLLNTDPTEYYACAESSKPNTIYKHNSNMIIGKYENGYDFGITYDLRLHQLNRKYIEKINKEQTYTNENLIYCKRVIDATYDNVKNKISNYVKINDILDNKVKNKVKAQFLIYNPNEKEIDKNFEQQKTSTHKNTLINNLLIKAKEKALNKSEPNDLNFSTNKQINDLLLKYSNKENLSYNNINKEKEIKKDTEIEL